MYPCDPASCVIDPSELRSHYSADLENSADIFIPLVGIKDQKVNFVQKCSLFFFL